MSEVLGGALGGALEAKPSKKPHTVEVKEVTAAKETGSGQTAPPNDSQQMTFNMKDLVSLISTVVDKSSERSAEIIAKALVEARKPYVDPAQEENKETARKQMRETAKRIRSEIEAGRENCPHLQGSNQLSNFQGTGSSFVFHRLDTGEMVGICTNCQKVISSLNKTDHEFFRRKSGNVASSSGFRAFEDNNEAQRRGRLVNEDGSRSLGT